MGFDKPSPIYRGAFGSQLAMPVWVNVMNAAAEYLPARAIPVPRSLKKVEICTRSGRAGDGQVFRDDRRRAAPDNVRDLRDSGRNADAALPGPRRRPDPGGHSRPSSEALRLR